MSSPKNKKISQKDEINIEENEFNIKIFKRTSENYTHEVIEDTKIKRITSWRKSRKKFLQSLVFNIFSFGIIHLISLCYPNLYLKLYCNQRKAKECDFFLVEDIYGKLTLCKKIYKKDKTQNGINFSSDNSKKSIISSSISNYNFMNNNKLRKYLTKNLTYSFEYKSIIYEYDENKNEIIPVYMNLLNLTCKDIFIYFSEGLSSENLVKIFLNRYGKNEYNLNFNMVFLYYFKVEFPYLFLVLIVSAIELSLADIISFLSKLIIIVLSIVIGFLYIKLNIFAKFKREYTLDGENSLIRVKRSHKFDEKKEIFCTIKNSELLPGDIIFLKTNDIVPCDCLLLEGECMANSNNLTGNLNIFRKVSLENKNITFNYQSNKDNILYHGMKIVKTYSNLKKGYISALCINTGPNTYKANLLSNALYFFERKKEYTSSYDFLGEGRGTFLFLIIIIFLSSIVIGIIYLFMIRNNPGQHINLKDKAIRNNFLIILARVICKSVMPMYYLINTIILLIATFNLKSENIYTFDKSKLLSSSSIDTLFISKTGTLCEEKFEINGYHPISINHRNTNNIGYRTYTISQNKEINLQLVKYYKDYLNKQKESDINFNQSQRMDFNKYNLEKTAKKCCQYSALFLECLLSCNNLEKYGMEIFGNLLDAEIFKAMKWDIKADNNDNNIINSDIDFISDNNPDYSKVLYYDKNRNDIFPNNYYKITESMKSSNDIKNDKNQSDNNSWISKMLKPLKDVEGKSDISDTLISDKNFIENDITKCHINSYKLRIYKRFIKEGPFNSSSITYNFITKELRFNTKGTPEDILDKCIPSSIPENIDKIISFYRRKGFIVIICAGKKLSMDQYSDYYSEDKYLYDLLFYGFVTLKNKLKYEVIYALNDLRQFNCNFIINTGDDIYNTLPIGFESTILENKDIYSFDKDETKNRIIIKKLYDSKRDDKKQEENDINQINNDILNNDKYSKTSKPNFKNIVSDKSTKGQNFKIKPTKIIESQETSNTKYLKTDKKIQPLYLDNSATDISKENIETGQNQRSRNIRKGKEIGRTTTSKDLLFNFEENKFNISNKDIRKQFNITKKNTALLKDINLIESPKKLFNTRKTGNIIFPSQEIATSRSSHEMKTWYYYQGIFDENTELDEDCIYCVSGQVFDFLYQNKTKKHAKMLLEKIHKKCKIFYNMTSLSKSKVIDFYREYPNNCICTIGESQTDIDSIITSHIGINLQQPKNFNTILCHFYSSDANLLSIKKIIMAGRAMRENYLLMKISCCMYSLIINSYILCCFFREMDVIQGQLNFMELAYLILSIFAFSSKIDKDEKSNCIIQNKKLYYGHYIAQIIGLLIIKAFAIYFHASLYYPNDYIETKKIDKIYSTYYFIFCLEQLFSTVFVLNTISFYRKSCLFNTMFLIVLAIIFLYFTIIVTLNNSNFNVDLFHILYFEFFENIVDAYDENNKMKIFYVCGVDFLASVMVSRVIYHIFDKLSKNKSASNKTE